ncbi:hypothetical protein PPSIR1_41144 [Plesiocystis pacifica SIR-1]|uniref:Uncharacterized protein n=1 Tax=Plesiocystis pacifica SIR-1 TaxID=391625 RepID=A6GIR0_9BACT|nr:hypothetical protein PPSIR1_41144 [Plesiocystis pacifica SIR-1]
MGAMATRLWVVPRSMPMALPALRFLVVPASGSAI